MTVESGPGQPGGAGSGAGDAQFVGSIPDLYEQLLVPMIFTEPSELLADAVAARGPGDVLETAAGTGVLTRALRARLPDAEITATDLNAPMLTKAEAHTGLGGVRWQTADALDLPFEDESFDVVACQFGVMFFPDKVRGYAEAARVLRPGGHFVFNVWDRLENNAIPHVIQEALIAAAPTDPLLFMGRTPHGYFDVELVSEELIRAGLVPGDITAHDALSRSTAQEAATAFCQGTPLRGEIAKHATLDVDAATALATDALLDRFGPGPISGPIRWFQVTATPSR